MGLAWYVYGVKVCHYVEWNEWEVIERAYGVQGGSRVYFCMNTWITRCEVAPTLELAEEKNGAVGSGLISYLPRKFDEGWVTLLSSV